VIKTENSLKFLFSNNLRAVGSLKSTTSNSVKIPLSFLCNFAATSSELLNNTNGFQLLDNMAEDGTRGLLESLGAGSSPLVATINLSQAAYSKASLQVDLAGNSG
jgi:hypothetical protein